MQRLQCSGLRWLAYCAFLSGFHGLSLAATLTVTQTTTGTSTTVQIQNAGSQQVTIQSVSLDLNGESLLQKPGQSLDAGSKMEVQFTHQVPSRPGSYPMMTGIVMDENGRHRSHRSLGVFHQGLAALDQPTASLKLPRVLTHQALARLETTDASRWKMVLPDEIQSDGAVEDSRGALIDLHVDEAGLKGTWPVYAFKQTEINGVMRLEIITQKIKVENPLPYRRGYLPTAWLLTLFSASVTLMICSHRSPSSPWAVLSARVILIAGSYIALRFAPQLLKTLATDAPPGWWADGLSILTIHFAGSHYHYFFKYVADAYFGIVVALTVQAFYQRPGDAEARTDRYVAFLMAFASLIRGRWKQGIFPTEEARLGFLSFAVKAFYIPLIGSWAINNILHQGNLAQDFSWSLAQINIFLTAFFILVDTSCFAAGYMIESRALKNQIRSVEPTWLGWFVCLICYPPFNQVSFQPVDVALFPIHFSGGEWIKNGAETAVTLGWGLFAWASLSMGWKASNLTNRGIVDTGLYRYCRHPAYTVKCFVWLVEAIFLGRFNSGMILAFLVIYGLRAWTEERHLSRDPAYLEYRRRVPYACLPGII